MVGQIIIEESGVRFGELTLRFHVRTAEGELRFDGLTGRSDCGGYTVTSRSASAANGERRENVQLFTRIEAGGDRLALSGSAAASVPVQTFTVVVAGLRGDQLLTPSDPDLIAPAGRLLHGSLAAGYPAELSTPFAAVRCADGRFFVARCANLRVRPRRFALRRLGDTAELSVEEEQRGIDAGPRLMLANWNLGWFDDIETPVAAQRDAVARLFKVAPLAERTDVPAWVHSVRAALHFVFDASDGATLTFAEAGAEIARQTKERDLDGVLVTASGWTEPAAETVASWAPAARLGGLVGLVELRQRCHAAGARFALWVDPTVVPALPELAVAPLATDGESTGTEQTVWRRSNPGYESVRQLVRDQIERMVNAVGPDALALRTTPAYLNTTGVDFAEGLIALLGELKQSSPEFGWFVERPRDYLASDASLAFVAEPAIAPGLAPLRTLGIPLVATPHDVGRTSALPVDGSTLPCLTIRGKTDGDRAAQLLAALLGSR